MKEIRVKDYEELKNLCYKAGLDRLLEIAYLCEKETYSLKDKKTKEFLLKWFNEVVEEKDCIKVEEFKDYALGFILMTVIKSLLKKQREK